MKQKLTPLITGLVLVAASLVIYANDIPDYSITLNGKVDKTRISDQEAMWSLFIMVAFADKQNYGTGLKFIKNVIQLNGEDANKLDEYITASIQADMEYQENLQKKLCAGSESLKYSNVILGQEMNRITSLIEGFQQQKASGVADIFTDENSANHLIHWVSEHQRETIEVTRIDYSKFLNSPGVSASSVIDSVCQSTTR